MADAIERGDLAHLRSELGDLLFQVVFHAQMAREAGAFDFEAVVGGDLRQAGAAPSACVRRGAGCAADGASRASRGRTSRRRRARAPASALDGVPQALPALMRADKLSKRAARVGFDFEHAARRADKVAEELAEVRDGRAPARAGPRRAVAGDFRGGRRPAVRGRQSGAQAGCRRGERAARREREVRAALPRHGGAWRERAA